MYYVFNDPAFNTTTELSKSLDVEEVAAVVRRGRLRWFGHLERKGNEDWVSACRMYEYDSAVGRRGKGRPRKTWEECVMHDLHQLGLRRESALDRVEWRGLIGGKRPTRAERGQMTK